MCKEIFREFYDVLDAKYVLTMDQLVKNGYPIWEDESKKLVKLIASERDSKKKLFADENGQCFVVVV